MNGSATYVADSVCGFQLISKFLCLFDIMAGGGGGGGGGGYGVRTCT